MYKSEITAVFLAALLFTGVLTAVIPSFIEDAEAHTLDDLRSFIENADAKDMTDLRKTIEASLDEEKNGDTKSEASTDEEKNGDTKSEASTDLREIKYKDILGDQYSNYNKFNQDYNQKSSGSQNTSSKETGFYNGSSTSEETITKPSPGTNFSIDSDKKILVVCPDGSKLPVHRVLYPSEIGVGERIFIDNVIQKICPAIDSCEECFEWLLNFADNRKEAVAIVNTVINALNKAVIGSPYLDNVKIGVQGYEGPNLWEISQSFNRLFEDDVNQKQAISTLVNTIKKAVDEEEVTPIVGALALNIIECIAELEGIQISLTPTQGIPIIDNTNKNSNNEQSQKYGTPLPITNDY